MNELETQRLLKNYFNARKSWEAWCYLNNIGLKNDKYHIKKYTDNNELLYYCRFILLKDIHIELHKILKDNNRTSVDNIFKFLRAQNCKSSQESIKKAEELKPIFDDLTNARDKFYAHLDEDYKSYINPFSIENYYKVFEFIENSIIILGKEKELYEILETIPSRDEFDLKII